MAFANYSELKAEIADWLNRTDLAAQIPNFITLLEARVNRELRTHDMVKRSTAVVDHGYFVVPNDWLETIALLQLGNRPKRLDFVSIEDSFSLREKYGNARGYTVPQIYTQMDGKFFLFPEPQANVELELVYRAKIPSLSEGLVDGNGADISVPTNWLLKKSPDLYLFGSLAEAEPYLKNDERVALWQSKADRILASMQAEAERASYPQGALAANRRTFG